MILAFLIATGQLDIIYKNKVEYLVVLSTIMFVWTFIYDFKKFKMDIDRIPKTPAQAIAQPVFINQMNMIPQQNFNTVSWTGQNINSFETV